jgi:hypothetical protein
VGRVAELGALGDSAHMKRLSPFWLALIIAAIVECILVVAAATFAFPYFGAGDGQHDTEFVTFCRMAVAVMHLPTIILGRSFLEGSRLLLPFIVIANTVFLTIIFWPVIALWRRHCEKRQVA